MKRLAAAILVLLVLLPACTRSDDPQSSVRESFSDWDLVDPKDPSLPELIIPVDDHFRLDPELEVETIEYYYSSWVPGSFPRREYGRIEKQEGIYYLDSQIIDPQLIDRVIAELDHLYPTLREHVARSPEYRYHSGFELTITTSDNNRIIINTHSDGNPQLLPWHLYYNGRQYAQFDGTIAKAMHELTQHRNWELEDYAPGGWDPARIHFAARFQTTQLYYQVEGLVPLGSGFEYTANQGADNQDASISGEIALYPNGYLPVGEKGLQVKDFDAVTIFSPDRQIQFNCHINFKEGRTYADIYYATDPVVWEFHCPLTGISPRGRYRYPIQVDILFEGGETFTTEGVLWGRWEQQESDIFYHPVPTEIYLPLQAAGVEILKNHVLVDAEYFGAIDAATGNPVGGNFAGEVVLLGEHPTANGVIPYSISTPFVIEEGRLLRWDLTQEVIDEMFADILKSPLAQKALSLDPQTVLNLWYAQPYDGEINISTALTNNRSLDTFNIDPLLCSNLPDIGLLPNRDLPLRGFSFNTGWDFWDMGFLLAGDEIILLRMEFDWDDSSRVKLAEVYLPNELDTGDHPPFRSVWFVNTYLPSVGVNPPVSFEDETVDQVYYEIFASLPFSTETSFPYSWDIKDAILVVGEDGTLELAPCSETR